ncbi:TPA: hypothetical protein ACKRRR_002975, partial [Pseudomonas aeruginosa]
KINKLQKNYLSNYPKLPFKVIAESQEPRGLQLSSTVKLPKLPFPKGSRENQARRGLWPLPEKHLLCRVSQGFIAAESHQQRPPSLLAGVRRKCRKRGLFRAEAWRGDDCVRRVKYPTRGCKKP